MTQSKVLLLGQLKCLLPTYPAVNYTLKVNNRNTRTRCEICSKLTIETLEQGVKYVQS